MAVAGGSNADHAPTERYPGRRCSHPEGLARPTANFGTANNEHKTEYMTTLYRAVGFTNSTYMDGSPEVGWKGEFFLTREEAEEAGCGVGDSWHNGEEVREYTIDEFENVEVDGEAAGRSTEREVLNAVRDVGVSA